MKRVSYSRVAVISLNLHSTHLKPSLTPNPRWPTEILRENKGRDAKKRPQEKRAGVRNRLRAWAHQAPLPSILLANVQSLDNKIDNLQARIKFQRDIRDCNLLCFTESWLNPAVPNHAIKPTKFFSVHRMDRAADSGKLRGGGVCDGEIGHSTTATPHTRTATRISHPSFGKSDHAAIFVIPKYKQWLKREALVQREVARWTDQSVAALQDALDDADWDMFRCSTDDVSKFTEAVVGCIGKLVDDTIPRTTIKKFPNQEPWVAKTIREALNSHTAAYNPGIISGNMDESAAYGVRRVVREVKRRYGRKLESQFQQSGSRSLWQGLWMIMGYRSPPTSL
ncbi:hypothetical protein P4O66_014078 [Electrophorus voltai]|uniref:Uncharacterized protein n=1 Tax=Electrophorus voltai TaxID=2609070 RepID=A0AAD8YZF8_9TELE|nr:hypothetical protein P4O66_014078 [Electrophorus voltai]